MKLLVVLALAVSCRAQYAFPYTGAVDYRVLDDGAVKGFAFSDYNQNRQEVRLPGGEVVGHYSYVGADGKPVVTYYNADALGFKVSSNNLPVAPVDTQFRAPEPVQETPEVAEQRRVLEELRYRAPSRSKRQVVTQYVHPFTATPFPLQYTYKPSVPLTYHSLLYPYNINTGIYYPYTIPVKTETEEKTRVRRDVDQTKVDAFPKPVYPSVYSMYGQYTPSVNTKYTGRTPADTTKLTFSNIPFPTYPVVGTETTPITPYTSLTPYSTFFNVQPFSPIRPISYVIKPDVTKA